MKGRYFVITRFLGTYEETLRTWKFGNWTLYSVLKEGGITLTTESHSYVRTSWFSRNRCLFNVIGGGILENKVGTKSFCWRIKVFKNQIKIRNNRHEQIVRTCLLKLFSQKITGFFKISKDL